MKQIIQLYLLLYVLFGGFRHIQFEHAFFSMLHQEHPFPFIRYAAIILYLLALSYLIFGKNMILFIFYLLLLFTDFYIQNWVKFESSVILIHQIPLIAFLFLNEQKRFLDESVGRYILLLFLSVGFVSSGFAKAMSGWFDPHFLYLKSDIHVFQSLFKIPVYWKESSLNELPFEFWKMLDYIVVLFQLSFIQFFFNLHVLKWRFLGLIIFHVSISLLLGIHVFFSFFLVYFLVFIPWEFDFYQRSFNRLYQIIASAIFVVFLWFHFDTDVLIRMMSFQCYLNLDFYLTLIFALILLFTIYKFNIDVNPEEH